MDHHIDTRHVFSLTPLFPGLNLTYARYLLHCFHFSFVSHVCSVTAIYVEQVNDYALIEPIVKYVRCKFPKT